MVDRLSDETEYVNWTRPIELFLELALLLWFLEKILKPVEKNAAS
jgi:hypothetical protein